jgi:hypothetical protein
MHPMHGDYTVQDRGKLARDLRRVLLGTAAVLMVPLVAMRFTNEVNWGALDFVAAAILLAATGSAYVLLTRKLRTVSQRRAIGGGLLLTLLLVWAELAVGLFGSPLAGS